MRYICFAAYLISICPAFAQKGPCTEKFIRAESANPTLTDDFYLFNPLLEKPVIGENERKKADEAIAPLAAKRKNFKAEPWEIDRVVVAPSGDMAYQYGTRHFSYDDSDTGKHVDGIHALLRVWRADGGSCKMAASMLQREGQR